MNHSRSSPLGPREHNINELRSGGDRVHLFKVIDRHDDDVNVDIGGMLVGYVNVRVSQ